MLDLHWCPVWLHILTLVVLPLLYHLHWISSPYQMRLLSTNLSACHRLANFPTVVATSFISAAPNSYSACLISPFGIMGLFLCRISVLISWNFSISIDLVLSLCARIPHVVSQIIMLLLAQIIESFTSCFRISDLFSIRHCNESG